MVTIESSLNHDCYCYSPQTPVMFDWSYSAPPTGSLTKKCNKILVVTIQIQKVAAKSLLHSVPSLLSAWATLLAGSTEQVHEQDIFWPHINRCKKDAGVRIYSQRLLLCARRLRILFVVGRVHFQKRRRFVRCNRVNGMLLVYHFTDFPLNL